MNNEIITLLESYNEPIKIREELINPIETREFLLYLLIMFLGLILTWADLTSL